MSATSWVLGPPLPQSVAASTRYLPVGMGFGQGFLTEAFSTVTFREAGTLSRLYVSIDSNDHTSIVVTVRKNGADGNGTVSYGSSETGEKLDASNTDTVAAGDTLALRVVAAGGTAYTIRAIGYVFTVASGRVVKYINHASTGISDSSVTYFNQLAGRANFTSTEAERQFTALTAGTLKNLQVNGTNNGANDITIGTRINGVNGNLAVTLVSAENGPKEDTVNTDTVAAGDEIGLYITTGAGMVSSGFLLSCDFVTTDHFQYLTAGIDEAFAASVTTALPIAGGLFQPGASDANLAQRLSQMTLRVADNGVTGSTTLRLLKNGSPANQTITIGGGVTGVLQDLTNTDTVLATDELSYELVVGAGGTELVIDYITIRGSAPTAIPVLQQSYRQRRVA